MFSPDSFPSVPRVSACERACFQSIQEPFLCFGVLMYHVCVCVSVCVCVWLCCLFIWPFIHLLSYFSHPFLAALLPALAHLAPSPVAVGAGRPHVSATDSMLISLKHTDLSTCHFLKWDRRRNNWKYDNALIDRRLPFVSFVNGEILLC